ncbi:MAG TPA: lipid II flippase MurJ [Ktedonobacterales bacterium]|jgi:putative peptidoglycan lipid II flippase
MPDRDDAPLPTNIADEETAIAGALASPTVGPTGASGARGRIVAAAAIIMVGQLLSSVLGLVRIETLNVLFYGAASGAFIIALRPIQQVSDLVVAGSISGALIPTFVDYGDPAHRESLRRAYSTILNLVIIAMAIAALILLLAAPSLVPFWIDPKLVDPSSEALAIELVRIAAFALFGLGLYAVTSALLYALKEVILPAFATGIFHVGIVLGGVIGLLLVAAQLHLPLSELFQNSGSPTVEQARLLGARGLAVGAVVGALGEFLFLLPGLRKTRISWRPVLDLRHPAVRQALRLYAPIVGFLLITFAQQNVDLFLIGRTPGNPLANATALQSATTLIQFPTGLVAAALTFAVLPALTAAATRADTPEFKRILILGFRLGLLLMVPAAVGLIVLRDPIVELLFQHGTCQATNGCSYRNALALLNYSYQLPFLALGQLLIAAFYARKNTLTPAVIGAIAILFYLAIAVPFGPIIGMPAIAFANTALNVGNALILFVLLTLAIGNLGMRELLDGAGRIALAALAMAIVSFGLLLLLPRLIPAFNSSGTLAAALTLLIAGGAGVAVYFVLARLLDLEELRLLSGIVRARLGRNR